MIAVYPELFPHDIAGGYTLKEMRYSKKKLGLRAASTAVTRMEPVRDVAPVLAVKLRVIAPELVQIEPM